MDPKHKSSFLRTLVISIIALGCAGSLLCSGFATRHALARSGNKSASRPHKATLRVSDSPEGSRIVLTADQSLNSYEAYRRGDRFYLKIPLSSIPVDDSVRGHAFSEVRIEQSYGATIISFHLHPDATTRVEQRGNKIEIVFLASRARLARAAIANRAALNSSVKRSTKNDGSQNLKARLASKADTATKSKAALGSSARTVPGRVSSERNNGQTRPSPPARAANSQKQDAPAVKLGLATTAKKPAVAAQTATTAEPNSVGVKAKESANNWLPAARVNRLTVGLGAGLLLSLFALIFIKRHTAKVRAIPAEAMLDDETEVETVVPVVTAAVALSTSEELQPSPVEERGAREQTVSSAIGKLILDNTHRADVMNSRAPEDRKAIESSLLDIITAAETSRDECRRAREALEQYGFVAQHNATLLKGRNAWERSFAARALGTIGSKSSLPFLIEALNDSDSIVRNEAVVGLAALKDPAAIGALVEASRKHPDLAASLLSQTLNACSVDGAAWTDSPSEAAATGRANVSANDDGDWVELSQDGMSDDILSGWLALVDDPNEGADVPDFKVSPPIVRPAYEQRYLRVVA